MDTEDTDDDPITSLLEHFEEMQSLFKQNGKIWTPWIAKVSEDGKVRYLLSVESIINYLKGGMLEILETGGMELNRSAFEDIPGVGQVAKITPFPNRLQKPESKTNMQSDGVKEDSGQTAQHELEENYVIGTLSGRSGLSDSFNLSKEDREAEEALLLILFPEDSEVEDPEFEEALRALRAERKARLKGKREPDRKKAKAQCDEKAKQLRAQYGDDIFIDYDLEEGEVHWGWKLF